MRWSFKIRLLFVFLAVITVIFMLLAARSVVRELANDERRKVRVWADAVQKKAEMVSSMEVFFTQLEQEERKKLELWSDAYRRLLTANFERANFSDFDYYRKVVAQNTTIPFLLADNNQQIIFTQNLDSTYTIGQRLNEEMLNKFSEYEPIKFELKKNITYYLYYQQSHIYMQLHSVMDGLVNSFFAEIVDNTIYVPIIITDETETYVKGYGNIEPDKFLSAEALKNTLEHMASQNKPIIINVSTSEKLHIYYENSKLFNNLSLFPYVFIIVMVVFLILVIMSLSFIRRSAQDTLWVGMSRETAHQLGTPLSSLIAWTEYLRAKEVDEQALAEINKDLKRLEVIANRFSKIGSVPELKTQNLTTVIYRTIAYLKTRISKKIIFDINIPETSVVLLEMNDTLFSWVIENICKNATDAIGEHQGYICVNIIEKGKHVIIDVSDNGKGMTKAVARKVFIAGFSTKPRGWGLGLPLCKRVVTDYHKGKIFIKNTAVGKGTTFRIILNKL